MRFLLPSVALRILLVTKSTAFFDFSVGLRMFFSRRWCHLPPPDWKSGGCRQRPPWNTVGGTGSGIFETQWAAQAPSSPKNTCPPLRNEKCICAFCSRQSLFAYFWSQKAQHFSISRSDCECFSREDGAFCRRRFVSAGRLNCCFRFFLFFRRPYRNAFFEKTVPSAAGELWVWGRLNCCFHLLSVFQATLCECFSWEDGAYGRRRIESVGRLNCSLQFLLNFLASFNVLTEKCRWLCYNIVNWRSFKGTVREDRSSVCWQVLMLSKYMKSESFYQF